MNGQAESDSLGNLSRNPEMTLENIGAYPVLGHILIKTAKSTIVFAGTRKRKGRKESHYEG